MHTIVAVSRGVLGMSARRVVSLVTCMSELVDLGTRSLAARPSGLDDIPRELKRAPSWYFYIH